MGSPGPQAGLEHCHQLLPNTSLARAFVDFHQINFLGRRGLLFLDFADMLYRHTELLQVTHFRLGFNNVVRACDLFMMLLDVLGASVDFFQVFFLII